MLAVLTHQFDIAEIFYKTGKVKPDYLNKNHDTVMTIAERENNQEASNYLRSQFPDLFDNFKPKLNFSHFKNKINIEIETLANPDYEDSVI